MDEQLTRTLKDLYRIQKKIDDLTVEKNQLKKCLTAEYLVFVQAPCEYWNEAAIYQVESGFKYGTNRMKNGDERVTIPINQPAINKLCPKEGNDKEILRHYATNYNG